MERGRLEAARRAVACERAAEALLAVHRVSLARELWVEAREHHRRAGSAADVERIQRTLRALRDADPPVADRLTPTERSVALLVADGLTTPQIARRLTVSPRTVQTHLKNIFGKLGINSRARLAAEVTAGLAAAG